MNELRLIRLSHNPLMIFDPDISHMHSLQSLFLDDTSLSYLCPRTRDFIDQRLQNGSSFVVDLQQSSIFCDCDNFLFLKWMTTSKAFNLTSQDYQCKYPDSTFQNIYDGYSEVIGDLTRQCVSHETLFFIVASMTCMIALVIIGSLIYRYRWKLRYIYYATYLYLKPGDETTAIRNFEYDVFICYAEEDRDFVLDVLNDALESRGFKVFIHSRDFAAGEFIGSNIVRAVRSCRRTVVVLTRALAESSWCGYEIQMANMESAHRGYPVLIFLLKDDMTDSEMGVELLYNVRNNTYVPFPPESDTSEESLRTLWDKLAMDIKK
ncbi:hypothetical protein PoB_005238800 [Plakobranchus ocellatus]|uniref:TIR domain-containing protein n=1 Tax=Plakobranchus ocellatus TaxID=259542 RepID=A0AAV4C1U7_9GAST|nr:hypothetical protein PoB_005238800 [Plakobranchus ocellatus]